MPVAYVQCLQKIIDNVKHNESSKLLSRYVLVECAQGLICQDVNHVVPCEGSLQSMKVSRGPRHDWQNGMNSYQTRPLRRKIRRRLK